MSGAAPELPTDWVWQGFGGTATAATTNKTAMEAQLTAGTFPVEVGVVFPPVAQAPMIYTKAKGTGALGAFAVQTRRASPTTVPPGMIELDAALTGRFVNA